MDFCGHEGLSWVGVSRALDRRPLLFQWLNEEKVIQRLVELIHPSQDEDVSDQLCSGAWPAARAVAPPSEAGQPRSYLLS